MKQYLKRVLSTFLFLIALIVLTAALCTLIIHFFIWFRPQLRIVLYIGLLLSTATMLYIVFLKRWENKSIKATYLEAQATEAYSFKKDYLITLTSKENTVHTLAFLSIALLNGVRIAASTPRPIWGLFIQIGILLLLFSALNTLVWCFVHRRWHKNFYGTK